MGNHPSDEPPTEVAIQIARGQPRKAIRLSQWVERLVAHVAPRADSFGLRFTGDEEVQQLNLRYRGRDRATDVLSFPGEQTGDSFHLGDVVISVPAAQRQATELEHSLDTELRRLVLHGVLHCLGYDHEADDGSMDRKERALRAEWIDER